MKKATILFVIAYYFAPGFLFGQVQLVPQKQSNWCWAACTEMILKYYSINANQCEIVNGFNDNNCNGTCDCNNVNYSSCNRLLEIGTFSGLNPQILNLSNNFIHLFGSYDLTPTETLSNGFLWADIVEQHNSNRPLILVRKSDNSLTYHATVIIDNGYNSDGSKFVTELNPLLLPSTASECEGIINQTRNYDNDENENNYFSWVYNFPIPTYSTLPPTLPKYATKKIPAPDFKVIDDCLKPYLVTYSPSIKKIYSNYFNLAKRCRANFCTNCFNETPYDFNKLTLLKEISFDLMINKKNKSIERTFKKNTTYIAQNSQIDNFQLRIKRVKNAKKLFPNYKNITTNEPYWIIESFDHFSYIKLMKDRFYLNPKLEKKTIRVGTKKIPYYLITYPYFNYVFVGFSYKGHNYIFSLNSINEIKVNGKPITKNTVYSRNTFFKSLKVHSLSYLNVLKTTTKEGVIYSR